MPILAHGGSLTWDEILLVIGAFVLFLTLAASGRNRRLESVSGAVIAHRALADQPDGTRGVAISVLDVSHRYGKQWVLTRCSLTITPGQFVSILGANGAGKTTLLNILSTVEVPTVGDVVVGEASSRSAPEAVRSNVGVVAHQPLLYPKLTVIENLRFFACLFGLDDKSRIETMLRQVSMWEQRHDQVGKLSHGQRQRVGFARALLHSPCVLLLDEPYAGLDLVAAERLDELLSQLHIIGHTIVMTSHDLTRSYERADRLIVLANGRLAHDLTSSEHSMAEVEDLYRAALVDGHDGSRVVAPTDDEGRIRRSAAAESGAT